MDDEQGPGDPETAVNAEGPATRAGTAPPDRVTVGQFASALAVACVLLFVMLAVFAVAGLGPLGIWPALVVATALTGRVTKIRRVSVLIALGVLSLVIVVGVTYTVTIAVILGTQT